MTMQSNKRILILEDDSDIANLFSQLLSSYGTEPLVCQTEEEVFAALENGSISLALLDIMLPSTDGRNIAQKLRKQKVEFPIYFMTGIRESSIGDEYRQIADGILRKPFSIRDLSDILDQTIQAGSAPAGSEPLQRQLLQLMTTVASEQENLRRQESQLASLIAEAERLSEGQFSHLSEQFREFHMGLQASLSRFANRLELIRGLLKDDDTD